MVGESDMGPVGTRLVMAVKGLEVGLQRRGSEYWYCFLGMLDKGIMLNSGDSRCN